MAGNSLQAMLNRAKASDEQHSAAAPAPVATSPRRKPKAVPPKIEQPTTRTQPGRAGTKLIGGHFPPEVSTQLRILAAEENTTIQALLAEALDDLFVKKGKKRISR